MKVLKKKNTWNHQMLAEDKMFLSRPKKAFTLAETLLVLLIIGVVSAATVMTIKPGDKALKYSYSSAYNGLSDSFYNVILNNSQSDIFAAKGPKKLCEGLTEYITTLETNCSDSNVVGLKADSFEDKNIQFVSVNGMRFYFSERNDITYKIDTEDKKLKYFMVYVDTNGKKKPNRLGNDPVAEASNKKSLPSDIFAFALLETGKTVPLGLPEIETKYMQARLAFYNGQADIEYAEPSLPYYLAKNVAWGCYDDIPDGVLSEEEKGNKLLFNDPEEPHTMNDIIRKNLPANSKIKIDIPKIDPDSIYSLKDDDKYKCTRFDYENCFIAVDVYN